MESSARGWWIWLSFASRAYPLAWPLEPQPGRGLGLTGFASRSMSLVPGSCSLHAARPRAPSLLLFKLGMRTSVAGILQASSASPGRRSGACAEQAESWRWPPPRCPSHRHRVGFQPLAQRLHPEQGSFQGEARNKSSKREFANGSILHRNV